MKIWLLLNIILLIAFNNKLIVDFSIIYIFIDLVSLKYKKSFILLILLLLDFVYIFNIKKTKLIFLKLILSFNSLSPNN